MEQKKTDESIKTGLAVEAGKLPIAGAETHTSDEDALKETDADDLIHEQDTEIKANGDEQDIDEMVHRAPSVKTVTGDQEIDGDDLVHQK